MLITFGELALGLLLLRVDLALVLSALIALVGALPVLIGSRVGLPPLAALLSLYVGFQAFGVAGMILAPLLAVLVRQLWSALRPHAARPPA